MLWKNRSSSTFCKMESGVMCSSLKRRSGTQLLGHEKRDIPACIRHCLTALTCKFEQLTTKILDTSTDKIALSCKPKGEKLKKENLISDSLRGNFWQLPLIAAEAWKEHSCHSFSASHIGPEAERNVRSICLYRNWECKTFSFWWQLEKHHT